MATSPEVLNSLDRVSVPGQRIAGDSISKRVYYELQQREVVKTNLFTINISKPGCLSGGNFPEFDDVETIASYRGDTASVPGLQLNTSSVRRYGVGMEERKPISAIVVDQTFTFIGDKEGVLYNFFYAWINNIVVTDRYGNMPDGIGGQPVVSSGAPGSVKYKNGQQGYGTTIQIKVFDHTSDRGQEQLIHHIVLENAYPVFLGDVGLNWAGSNDFIRIPVTFTYSHWYLKSYNVETGVTSVSRGIGISDVIQGVYKAGTAVLALSSLRKPRSIQDVLSVVNNAKVVLSGYGNLFSFGN